MFWFFFSFLTPYVTADRNIYVRVDIVRRVYYRISPIVACFLYTHDDGLALVRACAYTCKTSARIYAPRAVTRQNPCKTRVGSRAYRVGGPRHLRMNCIFIYLRVRNVRNTARRKNWSLLRLLRPFSVFRVTPGRGRITGRRPGRPVRVRSAPPPRSRNVGSL